MKYNTLLFDADSTLFDFDKAEEVSLHSFYERADITCPFDEFYEVYERENRLMWKAFEEGCASPDEVKVQRFENTIRKLSLNNSDAEELSRIYIEELAKCDFLLHGAEELIDKIKDDYNLIFITNGLWDVQKKRIGNSEINRHFDGLVVSEKVGSAKPDSGIFDEAFKEASYPDKDKVLIIGDSLTSDIKGGILYGIDTCWYNPTGKKAVEHIKPTYDVRSFDELEKLLSKKVL